MPHALSASLTAPGCTASLKQHNNSLLKHRCTSELGHDVHISPSVTRSRTLQASKSAGCCRAGNEERIRQASADYLEGLREGVNEDDLVAQELGLENASQMTTVQERYKDRIKQKLQEQAAAAAAEKAARQREFTLGKMAYGKGQYNAAVQLFTQALDKEGPFSPLGGEVQLWLALAYQATGREQDCIELYKTLENTHPNANIKKQAANLRFIMEAPKLKLGPDERVSIPVIETSDRFAPERTFRARAAPSRGKVGQQREMTWEERFFAEYQPPQLIPNKYVLVASIILAVSLAWYSAAARQGGL